MKKWHRWMAVSAATVMVAGIASTASGTLIDLAGHWAAPLISALEARGIVAGDLDGRFDPNGSLTRAQLAKLLVVGIGNQADAQLLSRYDSRFADIPRWHWANGYIEALSEMAVTEGYPDGTFGPSDTVTRAQLAVFLVRALGLEDQAWSMHLIPTMYADDAEIPDWARGAVHVALSDGVMNGFEGGVFRPLQPVTKAEGATALLRLLGRMGRVYNLAGSLVRFDPNTLQGVVRDELGQERPFVMDARSQYYRAGLPTQVAQIRTADQVWIVFGSDGKGRLMEARYTDFIGNRVTVQGNLLTLFKPDDGQQTFTVEPGALVYLNGRPTTLQQLQGAPRAYLVLDGDTGDVRIVDAVNAPLQGTLSSIDVAGQTLVVNTGTERKSLKAAGDAVIILNWQRARLQNLHPGDRLQIAADETGTITYVQAER